MTNETISGETVTKKRRRKIHFILVISVIIGKIFPYGLLLD